MHQSTSYQSFVEGGECELGSYWHISLIAPLSLPARLVARSTHISVAFCNCVVSVCARGVSVRCRSVNADVRFNSMSSVSSV